MDSALVDGVDVTNDLVPAGSNYSYTFPPVTASRNLVVTFKRANAPVSSPPVGGGQTPVTTPSPTSSPTPTAEPGSTATPTARPVRVLSVTGFAPGSSQLGASQKMAIKKIARALSATKVITITGITQGPSLLPGDAALSKARAIAVRDYLVTLIRRKLTVVIATQASSLVGTKHRGVLIRINR